MHSKGARGVKRVKRKGRGVGSSGGDGGRRYEDQQTVVVLLRPGAAGNERNKRSA